MSWGAFGKPATVARATQHEPFRTRIPAGANGATLPGFPAQRGIKAVHVLTSSASNEAYTPPDVLEAARYALGGSIDLDPASCATANEEVQARGYFTEPRGAWRGGLLEPWFGADESRTVWLNPPGGFVHRETLLPAPRGMSQACAWWRKLLQEYRAGHVRAACFYTFRLDVLQNIQALDGYEPPHAYSFCILKARPRHWSTGTPREKRGKQGQPTHACAVFFLPERARLSRSQDRFLEAFTPLGYVRT